MGRCISPRNTDPESYRKAVEILTKYHRDKKRLPQEKADLLTNYNDDETDGYCPLQGNTYAVHKIDAGLSLDGNEEASDDDDGLSSADANKGWNWGRDGGSGVGIVDKPDDDGFKEKKKK
ncbi:unnamed protein product [Phytomonas sp. Hart1]|nr:unnamed protein product [Phytomonas sp. Hart1]|eukprot:CCW72213.1 unnamed protein product [Phytomonas sp. isolate Hart1]